MCLVEKFEIFHFFRNKISTKISKLLITLPAFLCENIHFQHNLGTYYLYDFFLEKYTANIPCASTIQQHYFLCFIARSVIF
jgi:hypothetical protein